MGVLVFKQEEQRLPLEISDFDTRLLSPPLQSCCLRTSASTLGTTPRGTKAELSFDNPYWI